MKHTVTETWLQNKDIVILVLRIYFGLRLLGGGLRRFFEWDRIDQFHQSLLRLNVQVHYSIILLIFLIQLLAGLSFMLGYKMKLAAIGIACVCAFLLIAVPAGHLFDEGMPPFATMILTLGFFFVSPGKFSLQHKLKHSYGRSVQK